MSSGGLNGGVLSVSKLVVGGSTFTGASGLTGLSTTPATGTTGADPCPFTVGTITNTTGAGTLAFTASGGGMSLGGNIQSSGGGGIPSLTTTPATGGTGAVATAFSATIVDTLASGATPTAVFTGSAGAMALAISTPPFAGGSGIPSLTTTPATAGTGAVATAFSATITQTSGTATAVFTGSAGGMALAINVPPSASALPAIIQAGTRAWGTSGTTDSLTLTAVPAGTFILQLSWAMATAPAGLLSVPAPTAGSTAQAVVASSSITAGDTYTYALIQLTT